MNLPSLSTGEAYAPDGALCDVCEDDDDNKRQPAVIVIDGNLLCKEHGDEELSAIL